MEGRKWTEFLESVETSGVIEPIVVTGTTPSYPGISACGRVREYAIEDAILKDLLKTNVRSG